MSELVYDPNLELVSILGIPIPTGRKPVSANEIMDKLKSELAKDYEGPNPALIGLSKGEAALKLLADKAADGDIESLKLIMDRTMGKSVQQVQNLNVNTTLVEFLEQLKKAREGKNGS